MNTKKFFTIATVALFFSTSLIAQQIAKDEVKPVLAQPSAIIDSKVPAPGTRVVATEPVNNAKMQQPTPLKALTPVAEVETPSPLTRQQTEVAPTTQDLKLQVLKVEEIKPKYTEEMKATMNGTHKTKSIIDKSAALTPAQPIPLKAQPVAVAPIEN
jgi:hypothetical protein